MNKQKKIVIFVIFIVILIFVGIGIFLYINQKSTPPNNPVIGDNRYQIDPNVLLYEGSVKSVRNKTIILNVDGKQLDIDVRSRVSVFNASSSTKKDVLQTSNTVAIRFSIEENAVNKAISVSKIDSERIDNSSVLLNGNIGQQLFDVIGKVVEMSNSSFTIETDVKRQRLTFEVNDASFLMATSSDISEIAPQAHAKIWAREMGSRYRAILVVISK